MAALKLLDRLQKMLAAGRSGGCPPHRQTHAPLILPFSGATGPCSILSASDPPLTAASSPALLSQLQSQPPEINTTG